MVHRVWIRSTLAGIVAFGLSGCITIPAPLQGDYALAPVPSEAAAADVGQRLRWGGTLIEARPGEQQTCLELLARELDRQFRPRPGDAAFGRFLACHDAFLDPEVFAPGREVTVVGRLEGFEDGHVGDYPYRYPRLSTGAVYLWPERVEFDDRYYGPAWRYYGWPYWPYGGPYWIGYRSIYVPYPVPARPHGAVSAGPGSPAVRQH